jgi:uncharacterized protein (TIGR02452 family)
VEFAADLLSCVNATQCYSPESLEEIREQALSRPAEFEKTDFIVRNETTLQGCKALADSQSCEKIAALNFASAKNPGGGFLKGAQAQEESLARSSGLYNSLLACPSFYGFHRVNGSGIYSDRMIYSPRCPVFRNNDGVLLEKIYFVDFITSPAPNAGAIFRNEPGKFSEIENVLKERASKVLALAAYHRCDALALGAWGCGVFKNDPRTVSRIFYDLLCSGGLYGGRFKLAAFFTHDVSPGERTYRAFLKRFSG